MAGGEQERRAIGGQSTEQTAMVLFGLVDYLAVSQ